MCPEHVSLDSNQDFEHRVPKRKMESFRYNVPTGDKSMISTVEENTISWIQEADEIPYKFRKTTAKSNLENYPEDVEENKVSLREEEHDFSGKSRLQQLYQTSYSHPSVKMSQENSFPFPTQSGGPLLPSRLDVNQIQKRF